MLLFYLFSSLYAQPCPAGINTKISLLEKETVPKKVWTTQQKIPESAHIIIESTDTLPSFTTIRSTTSLSQDGYLIELNNSFVQVFRKGPYKDIPITKRVPISQKKQSSIHIMQNEASMELWVCRKEKTLAHIRWEDTAFSDGFVHIEHPSSLKHTQVSYLPESTIMQAMWPQDILHSSALLQVEGEDLPPILEQGLISNPLEPGLWSLLADRYSIATILPYKKNIVSISKSIPYWAINNKQHIPPIKQEEELIRLVQKYDVELHQIGTSRQGRAIWAMQVAPSNKKKPSVLFMGGISGNDVHSTQNTFEQLYHLLETQDGLIELWKEKLDIWFVPTLNIDGSHYFWYRNTHDGEAAPVDTNQDGTIDIGEGIFLNQNTQFLFAQSPQTTRGSSPQSTPELQALSSLARRISPSLSVSWTSVRTAVQEDLYLNHGTHSLALPPQNYSQLEIDSQLNLLLAGPAIRIIVSDEYNHPIQAEITVHPSKRKWATKNDGLWVHPVSAHKPYTITIGAPSYQEETIRIQTNRLYRVQLKQIH